MAQLPTAESLGQRPTPSPNLSVVPVPYGAPEAGLSQLGETISNVGASIQQMRRASQLTDALGKATIALSQKQLEYERDPDFKTVPQRFQQDAATIGNDAALSIDDGMVQKLFKDEYSKLATGRQLSVMQNAFHQEADYHKGNLQTNLEGVAHSAAFANNDLDRANIANVAKVMIGEMESSRYITHTEAARFQQQFMQRVQEQSIQRDIDADPVAAYKRLKTDPAYAANVDPVTRSRYEHWAKQAALPNEAKQDASSILKGEGFTEFADKSQGATEPAIQGMRLAVSSPMGGRPAGEPVQVGDRIYLDGRDVTDIAKAGGTVQPTSSSATKAAGVPVTPRDIRANLGQWIAAAEAKAEQSHPNDAVYRDMVVNQVKNYVTTIAAAQEGQQRQASGYLLGLVSGVDGGPKITSQDQLFSNPDARRSFASLDPASQSGILSHIEANDRRAAMLEVKSRPGLYADVVKRMYLPDSDPKKITSPLQLLGMVSADGNGLSVQDFERGKRELIDALNPEGARFAHDKVNAIGAVTQMFKRSIFFSEQPEKAFDAAHRFNADLDSAVDAYRKQGKDPRLLLMQDKPDYFMTPDRLKTYMQGPKQAVADQAGKVIVTANPQVLIDEAKAALAKGAPRSAVEARLKKFGIESSALDGKAAEPPPVAEQTGFQ